MTNEKIKLKVKPIEYKGAVYWTINHPIARGLAFRTIDEAVKKAEKVVGDIWLAKNL